MSSEFDVIVIGSGPGGYVCAIRAAQQGLSVAVVEKREKHGGTCLNVGCIPSKAMLHTSELFEEAGHKFAGFGIGVGEPSLDLPAMMAHKDKTVGANVDGVAFLFKKNKITAFHGTGRLVSSDTVEVTKDDGTQEQIKGKAIVLATGSDSTPLRGVEIDEKRVVTSTGALELESVPEKLIVVGAGVIGLELGSVWRRLGSEVTVVEFLDRILPGMDSDIAKQCQRILKKQGLNFRLGSKVTKVEEDGNRLAVSVEPADSAGDPETLEADVVLVSIGRIPYTEGLGLDDVGVKLDERGRIETNDHWQTNIPNIYAIGDVISGPMLAHKAEDEGVAVADSIAGKVGHVNYGVIPNVVYTMPEIASVGKSEDELKAEGVAYNVGKFPFTANGRARAMGQTDGLVKILADKETDRVLGVHIVGPQAGDLIHEAAVIMEFGGSSEDLARTCHAHPTLSEAVKEAALGTYFKSIHI